MALKTVKELGPYKNYGTNGTNGTQCKAEVTMTRTSTGVTTEIKVSFARIVDGSYTSGKTNVEFYIDGVHIEKATKTPDVYVTTAEWVEYATYTHTDNNLPYNSPLTHSVQFTSTHTSGASPQLDFTSDVISISVGEYYTKAGGATVNSITDNGNNTLTIVTTMGDDGINNTVSDVHIYGFVDKFNDAPSNGNNHFSASVNTNPINYEIDGRTVTYTIKAPSTKATYKVRIRAYSISEMKDNPGGENKDSDTIYYYVKPGYGYVPSQPLLTCQDKKPTKKASYLLSWDEATPGNESSPVKGYLIYLYKKSKEGLSKLQEIDSVENTFVINGSNYELSKGDELYYKVLPYTTYGNGDKLYADNSMQSITITIVNSAVAHIPGVGQGQVWVRTEDGWREGVTVYVRDSDGQFKEGI